MTPLDTFVFYALQKIFMDIRLGYPLSEKEAKRAYQDLARTKRIRDKYQLKNNIPSWIKNK